MKQSSFSEQLKFNEESVSTTVILETAFSKEIRILLKKDQVMKEHKAPFPIIVHLLEGAITFGVKGEAHHLKKGAILTLDGNVPHDLKAKEDSIVRLTINIRDKAERVDEVAKNTR